VNSLFDDYQGASAMVALFDAPATLARLFEFETALAAVQAAAGVLPAAAAAHIAACTAVDADAVATVTAATAAAATPVVAMVDLLRARVAARDASAAAYVHHGATSQDALDTAFILQARAGLAHLDGELAAVAGQLAALAGRHRDTPMVARTLGRQAGVTTFGLKAARWLDALLDERAGLASLVPRLPLQFGGAVGTQAAYGRGAAALATALAARLGLAPARPWHSERGLPRALAAALASLAAACGKVGADLLRLTADEVGEVAEATAAGRGASSALPHKRNPVASIAVVAAAGRAPGLLATVYGNFDHAHERAAGAWHAEHLALRDLFLVAATAVGQLRRALQGLEVDTVAMLANLARGGGAVLAEAAVGVLAVPLGRAPAQAAVAAACAALAGQGGAFVDHLVAQPGVAAAVDRATLAAALEPAVHLGRAAALVDEVLARHAATAATP